ncbi:MAG: BON domain-containing protein [Chitinophagaceae bacterium]
MKEDEQQNQDPLLKKAILSGLHNDPRTDVSKMEVEVSDGVATLKGRADTEEEKKHAEEIAAAVTGVKQVENHLHIDIGLVHAVASFVTRIVSGDEKPKKEDEAKKEEE